MIKRIRALRDSLLEQAMSEGRTATGYMAESIADQLDAILAEDAGGWRKWAAVPADNSVWQWVRRGEWGFMRRRMSGDVDVVDIIRCVSGTSYGGFAHQIGGQHPDDAMCRPIEPPPQEPPP